MGKPKGKQKKYRFHGNQHVHLKKSPEQSEEHLLQPPIKK